MKVLVDQLNAKPAEIRRFLSGKLDANRARELADEMRATPHFGKAFALGDGIKHLLDRPHVALDALPCIVGAAVRDRGEGRPFFSLMRAFPVIWRSALS